MPSPSTLGRVNGAGSAARSAAARRGPRETQRSGRGCRSPWVKAGQTGRRCAMSDGAGSIRALATVTLDMGSLDNQAIERLAAAPGQRHGAFEVNGVGHLTAVEDFLAEQG